VIIINPEDIPEQAHRGAPLKNDVREFLANKKAQAAILKEYESTASARSTVTRLNAWAEEEDLPFEAMSRNGVVYIQKV